MTTCYDTDDVRPVYIAVPNGTEAYWEGWAEGVSTFAGAGDLEAHTVIRTLRLGETGRLDAEFIIGRLGSGLHSARVVDY